MVKLSKDRKIQRKNKSISYLLNKLEKCVAEEEQEEEEEKIFLSQEYFLRRLGLKKRSVDIYHHECPSIEKMKKIRINIMKLSIEKKNMIETIENPYDRKQIKRRRMMMDDMKRKRNEKMKKFNQHIREMKKVSLEEKEIEELMDIDFTQDEVLEYCTRPPVWMQVYDELKNY